MKKLLIIGLLLSVYGCGGGGSESPITPEATSYSLTGNFQKGPFIVGSKITIQELNDNLVPTGKTFSTETVSNKGDYNIDFQLDESLIEVSADGYYFNEVSGSLSNSTLSLSALANVAHTESINVNILTHLSKKRIQQLVSEGQSFSIAKNKAEQEVLKLFTVIDANWEINNFEDMNISEYGDNNAYLLLTSAIIQNINQSTPQLSEFIERLAQDLSDNGVVDTNTLIDSINSSAQAIDLATVGVNLANRYNELGEALNLPDFEALLNRAPVADAGTDQFGYIGTAVILNGSNSVDIDHDTLSYSWSLVESPEGSVAALTSADTVSPSLTPDVAGNYQVSLTVSDTKLTSEANIINISTNNRAPVADAGADLFVKAGNSIILDGSNSFDPDGDNLTYTWQISGVSGAAFVGSVWNMGKAPISSDLSPIQLILRVNDTDGLESTDHVNVTYAPNYTDNNDETISDGFGNMWEKNDDGLIYRRMGSPYHSGACNSKVTGGYADWRHPTLDELNLLHDERFGIPKIDLLYFPNTKSAFYGTDKTFPIDQIEKLNFGTTTHIGAYIRCIR